MKSFKYHIELEDESKFLISVAEYLRSLVAEYFKHDYDKLHFNKFDEAEYEINVNILNKNNYSLNEFYDVASKIQSKLSTVFEISNTVIKGYKEGIGIDFIIKEQEFKGSNIYKSLKGIDKYSL